MKKEEKDAIIADLTERYKNDKLTDVESTLWDYLTANQRHKIPELVGALTGMLSPYGYAVEIPESRVDVETVEAYGLRIRCDSPGRAVRIESLTDEMFEVVSCAGA